MFIDIHAHAHTRPFLQLDGHKPWPTPEDLIPFYDSIGVERGVLQPLIGPENYLPQANEEILDAVERYPDRFIPFCNIHPQAINNSPTAPLEKVLAKYKEAGCKGVGEVICNMSFFDPYLRNLFRAVQEVGFPLTFHLAHRIGGGYGIYDEAGLPGLDETLSSYPGINFLGHSADFWSQISTLSLPYERCGYPKGKVTEGAVPKLLRKHKNLFGDLSAGSGTNALIRDEEYAIKFLDEFQDQLLYGIDVCGVPIDPFHKKLAEFLQRLLKEGKLSQSAFNKISRENAIRLLNL